MIQGCGDTGIWGYWDTGVQGYGDTVYVPLPYIAFLSLMLFLTRSAVSCYGVLGRKAKDKLNKSKMKAKGRLKRTA